MSFSPGQNEFIAGRKLVQSRPEWVYSSRNYFIPGRNEFIAGHPERLPVPSSPRFPTTRSGFSANLPNPSANLSNSPAGLPDSLAVLPGFTAVLPTFRRSAWFQWFFARSRCRSCPSLEQLLSIIDGYRIVPALRAPDTVAANIGRAAVQPPPSGYWSVKFTPLPVVHACSRLS